MSSCDVPAVRTVRTAGCVALAAGQREAVPTRQLELEVLQDRRFSVGLTANLVLWSNSTENLSFCVHHLRLQVSAYFLPVVCVCTFHAGFDSCYLFVPTG